jgi:hypothetical protein
MGLRFGAVIFLYSGLLAAQTGEASRTIPAPGPESAGHLGLFGRVSPNAAPITQKQRFINYLLNTVGPVPIFKAAAIAGYEQGMHRPEEWRLGSSGYGKRVASQMAQNGAHSTLTYGASVLLNEDNRYFACACQGFGPRLGHALASTFTARRNGREVFSVSSTTGVVGASLISRAWMPPSWRHGRNIGDSIGFGFLGIAAMNVFREFLPQREELKAH